VDGEQVAPDPERGSRVWSGSSFELVESKLHPPPTRPGFVPRTVLVNLLLALDAKALICLVAPAGYGKTTVLAQWAQHRGRRVGWVSVDRRDNDPVVLLTYIAAAVDRVEPIDPGVFGALTSPGASLAATVVPRLAAAVSSMTQPVALVLDHAEVLSNWECLHMVAELAAQLPKGSQLLLASRATLPLPVALLRAQGQLVEIGVEELAMDQQEAHALLEGAGVQLVQAETTELIKRTEGWPAGLYLAALALRAGGSGRGGGIAFTGDDQFVAEYLRSEVLARLSSEQLTFLIRTSVLERMCGPLCDAVLATKGSDQILETLVRSNLLLIPLDRRGEWYRYHQLFQELLRAELDRREPELVPELQIRAAVWCEANGLPELAIDQAQAAGDTDRAARLVAAATIPTYAGGRIETVGRWLQWFQDHGAVERHLPVAVLGTFVQALLGKPAAAERWAAAAEHGSAVATLPDGSTTESWVALVRSLLCRDGVDRMGADAEIAVAGLAPGSRWRPSALFLKGVVWVLAGEPDRADPALAHTIEVATKVGGLPIASVALAERAIVAMQQQDWKRAATLAERASGVVEAGQLDNYIMSALVYAVAARTALHQGEVSRAHQQLARAARLRPLLTSAIPWLAVQTLLELGRAWLALDDAAGAKVSLRQARDILRRRPDLGVLPSQAEELQSKLNTIHADTKGFSSLTTAELRLLPLLSTHLTFAEIGQRLYISRHTVKTQAISIYRKLGVASRSQAVQRARQLGLTG
jgi:LuxR family transcriptional regulator, maltose regulon positive regulatory protein